VKRKDFDRWKKRMFHLRTFNEDWQLIHQKRWNEDSLCWEDKCDCEKDVKKVGFDVENK